MAGTFDRYADLRDNVPGAYQALLYCITHNIRVSGRCIGWLIDNHFELVSDTYYEDFEDSSRWSIAKAYILSLDDGFYRCWEEVGLTEMQPNKRYDQIFECVRMKEVTTTVWVTNEEEDLIYG